MASTAPSSRPTSIVWAWLCFVCSSSDGLVDYAGKSFCIFTSIFFAPAIVFLILASIGASVVASAAAAAAVVCATLGFVLTTIAAIWTAATVTIVWWCYDKESLIRRFIWLKSKIWCSSRGSLAQPRKSSTVSTRLTRSNRSGFSVSPEPTGPPAPISTGSSGSEAPAPSTPAKQQGASARAFDPTSPVKNSPSGSIKVPASVASSATSQSGSSFTDDSSKRPSSKHSSASQTGAGSAGLSPPTNKNYVSISDLRFTDPEHPLGRGAYGAVYRATSWEFGEVAFKCFTGDAKTLAKEAEMMQGLSHPNVLPFFAYVQDYDGTTIGIITPLCNRGSLFDYLESRAGAMLSMQQRYDLARQIITGMAYIHAMGIVHFDIKTANLLLQEGEDGALTVKIADFGLSEYEQTARGLKEDRTRGTSSYMAPELCTVGDQAATFAVDVYSIGAVLWSLLTLREPFAAMADAAILDAHRDGELLRLAVPAGVACEPEWAELVAACMEYCPQARPCCDHLRWRLEGLAQRLGGCCWE